MERIDLLAYYKFRDYNAAFLLFNRPLTFK